MTLVLKLQISKLKNAEYIMPKLKTNKGASKRFKRTGKGGFKHRAANRAHINTKMTTKA